MRFSPNLNIIELSGGIPESFQSPDPDSIRHAEEKVGCGLGAVPHIPARCQPSTSAAREDHGEIRVRVPVAICVAATVKDHRIMQQGIAVKILFSIEFG